MAIRDEPTRKLRAKAMIQARVEGKSIPEVAAQFNVCTKTVERTLSWARSADLFIEFEDKLMTELLPKAHESLMRALENEEDGNVALEIYKGRNLLKKQGQKTSIEVAEDNDLAKYVREVRDAADEWDRTIDGQVEQRGIGDGSGPKGLPAAGQTGVQATGDEQLAGQPESATESSAVAGQSGE